MCTAFYNNYVLFTILLCLCPGTNKYLDNHNHCITVFIFYLLLLLFGIQWQIWISGEGYGLRHMGWMELKTELKIKNNKKLF